MDSGENDGVLGLIPPRPPERRRQEFIDGLAELQLRPWDLAAKLERFGDDRPFKAIIRSIDRMMSGETKVSPEMSVIVEMLLRQHRRLTKRHGGLDWTLTEHGSYQAEVDGWYVYLSPQTRGRWILGCSSGPSRQDYSPPFGRWLDSLAEAKHKALVEVEEGMNEYAAIEHENEVMQSAP
ncbi:hypothetical protein GVY41_03065 [Frigidibacter albus]|uniref:Uncharacterized protein n=1 Tax=Frigidibacter albus TaxID=1465486 RepID=A0A6L8VFI1_9RHOB|nr:hypothetical protein [Frigidibacter albus]MZQ88342.1 hypothetical protein [Frigidibacter albus]NBE29984.1 hypothetical protein [Frigidibacter albus]GGH45963.1 hypothetical protein GCM10011341_06150 [Frigidibacter albus]